MQTRPSSLAAKNQMRELALQLAVSIAHGDEAPQETVDRAEAYTAFLVK